MNNTMKLGRLITTKKGYAFKSKWFTDRGVPVVKATNFTDSSIDTSSTQFVSEDIARQYKEWQIRTGDVVIQTVGSWPSSAASVVGKCIRVPEEANGALLNQNTVILNCKDGLDEDYLYYSLRDKRFSTFIENRARGSANQASITLNDIREFEIFSYNEERQLKIGRALRKYDDLIENNKRRIELLEESARQLYKEWFVRFRFPGHEHVKIIDGVPEGWSKKPLKEILTLNYGKALKADNRIPGDFPVYGSSGVVGSHNKALVKGPGIIVGRKGNVGSIHWSHLDFFPIDTVYFVSAEDSSYFVYYALLHTAFINTDVAVPGLNRDFAYSRKVVVPTDTLRTEFEEEVAPIFKQCHTLTKYNDQLSKARDLLLPKLMSGEIVA